MPLIPADKEDIQALLDEGMSNRAIARKYDVGETTVRSFIDRHDLQSANKRTPNAPKTQNQHQKAHNPQVMHPMYGHFGGLMGNPIQLPPISDIPTLQYMLQHKELEANRANFNYAELESKYKKLLEENTKLEIAVTRSEIEKDNAVKDALAGKGGLADMGMKALEIASQNEHLGQALAGIITKFTNAGGSGQPLLGTGDPIINELVATLNNLQPQKRKQLIAACMFLMQNDAMLNQIVAPAPPSM